MITLTDSGVVYRNPKPYLKSIHAWHPSIVSTPDGTLLAGFDLGEAIESLDYRTYLSRSKDRGKTWSQPEPLIRESFPRPSTPRPSTPRPSTPDSSTPRPSTHSVRLGSVRDGLIVGFGGRYFRDDPKEGLTNRENLGYVPMELILVRSQDGGQTWSKPETIRPPLIGPEFETCHRILELDDGRWLAPTATWRGWNGDAPHGFQSIVLVSHDQGQSWPEWVTVADQYSRRVISWEQGICQLLDGRLLAVVWSYDESLGKSLPNRFVLSSNGRTFSEPRENGLIGETAKIITLPDGRVLCLYRRTDKPGLWATVVEIHGDQWINRSELPIWQGEWTGMSGRASASDELGDLKFGFPSMLQLDNGEIFVVFWCLESGIHNIRWVRLNVV